MACFEFLVDRSTDAFSTLEVDPRLGANRAIVVHTGEHLVFDVGDLRPALARCTTLVAEMGCNLVRHLVGRP